MATCLGNGQRSLAGYSPWVLKRVKHDLANKQEIIGGDLEGCIRALRGYEDSLLV